jgi:hypothetical protein
MLRKFAVAALPLLVAACTAGQEPPTVPQLQSPAIPTLDPAVSSYRSPVTGYTHRVPVDPKPWTCPEAGPQNCGAPQS